MLDVHLASVKTMPTLAMTRFRFSLLSVLFVGGILAAGCTSGSDSGENEVVVPSDTIAPKTRADSVAYRLLQAHGADAWATAPYLRFDFGLETPEGIRTIARHLWNRTTGEYRIEWSTGPDSSYVALVNAQQDRDGRLAGIVYLNGEERTGAADSTARETAYVRFVNDTYWLLSPLKVFDPGVNRAYLPDSSTAEHDVLHVTFDDVGRTPGDQYWLYVSKETGRLDRWAYHLQQMPEEAPPRYYDWSHYQELSAPDGTVHLAVRKEAVGAEQALLTNNLSFPNSPPKGAFSAPEPILQSGE
jgi:hypothetical protein